MGTYKGTRENLGLHMATIASAQVREEQAGLDQRVDNLRALDLEPRVQLLDDSDVVPDDVMAYEYAFVCCLLKEVNPAFNTTFGSEPTALPCFKIFHREAMDFRYVLQESITLEIEQSYAHTVPLFDVRVFEVLVDVESLVQKVSVVMDETYECRYDPKAPKQDGDELKEITGHLHAPRSEPSG
jgi:hypothetical protein